MVGAKLELLDADGSVVADGVLNIGNGPGSQHFDFENNFDVAALRIRRKDPYSNVEIAEVEVYGIASTSNPTSYLAPDEEGCVAWQHYEPMNMIGTARSVESSLKDCRDRCANVDGCTKFSYWGDGGCHMNDETASIVTTDPTWSRSVSGHIDTCGIKHSAAVLNELLDNSKLVGPSCPLLFFLDGELQDIQNVGSNGYLYGDDTSAHSAKLVNNYEIQIVHRTISGAISEAKLSVQGNGPGQLWSCHWNLDVCLPEKDQDQFESYSVGLLGTPDGNQNNDWMDITGQSLQVVWDAEKAFEYCRSNWCVKQEDSIMTYYPEGATYNDFKCKEEPFVPIDLTNCVLSEEKIIKYCADESLAMVDSCKLDCCFGGCGDPEKPPEEPEYPPFDDVPVDAAPPPDPICTETYKESTGETVCSWTKDSAVKVVRQSAPIPDREPILYGIVIQPRLDEDLGQVVKFRVDNPFVNKADIYVRYDEKVGEYMMNPVCATMLDTAGCDPKAPEIVVGCFENEGADSFALVDIYFVSNEDPFIIDNAAPDIEVHECCRPLDVYKEPGYGTIMYTFEIQCNCQEDVIEN